MMEKGKGRKGNAKLELEVASVPETIERLLDNLGTRLTRSSRSASNSRKHKNDEKLKGQLEIPGDLSECNARHMQFDQGDGLVKPTSWLSSGAEIVRKHHCQLFQLRSSSAPATARRAPDQELDDTLHKKHRLPAVRRVKRGRQRNRRGTPIKVTPDSPLVLRWSDTDKGDEQSLEPQGPGSE